MHQVSQATEGFLAATCRHGTLHLNEDLLAIQRDSLDATSERKFVPIIIDFHRESQPIIRYRLDDVLTASMEPCPCGSVLLALDSIEGRCDDLFYFPASGARAGPPGMVTAFPDSIPRALSTSTAELESYVVVQRVPVEVEVAYSAPAAAPGGGHRGGRARLCERLAREAPRLAFSVEQARPGARKLRRVERAFELPQPAGAGPARGDDRQRDGGAA